MAKKTRLTQAAATIGAAMGKADRAAHQLAEASVAAKDELAGIGKKVKGLKKQLKKTKKKLKRAL